MHSSACWEQEVYDSWLWQLQWIWLCASFLAGLMLVHHLLSYQSGMHPAFCTPSIAFPRESHRVLVAFASLCRRLSFASLEGSCNCLTDIWSFRYVARCLGEFSKNFQTWKSHLSTSCTYSSSSFVSQQASDSLWQIRVVEILSACSESDSVSKAFVPRNLMCTLQIVLSQNWMNVVNSSVTEISVTSSISSPYKPDFFTSRTMEFFNTLPVCRNISFMAPGDLWPKYCIFSTLTTQGRFSNE